MDSVVQVPSEVYVARLMNHFNQQRKKIDQRLQDFSNVGRLSKTRLFEEFAFCLLTPQSKAKVCDVAIKRLVTLDLLLNGTREEIAPNLRGVRFHNNKAKWIINAREKFFNFILDFKEPTMAREMLVREFKGMGYKEASHFLRNIGYGRNLAILDRHILKNLVRMGLIKEIPHSISPKKYLEIEQKMKSFCLKQDISMAQLDLLLWSEETGEIFK